MYIYLSTLDGWMFFFKLYLPIMIYCKKFYWKQSIKSKIFLFYYQKFFNPFIRLYRLTYLKILLWYKVFELVYYFDSWGYYVYLSNIFCNFIYQIRNFAYFLCIFIFFIFWPCWEFFICNFLFKIPLFILFCFRSLLHVYPFLFILLNIFYVFLFYFLSLFLKFI